MCSNYRTVTAGSVAWSSTWVRRCIVAGALLVVGVTRPAFSQEKPNADQQFQEAREMAFAGKYVEARLLLSEIMTRQPNYADAHVLTARTYAWEGRFADARKELDVVLAAQPDHLDALSARADVGLWSENPDEAIRYADQGLVFYPNSEDLLLKKAKALIQKKEDEAAAVELNRILTINPANQEALDLLQSLKKNALKNFVTARYYLSFFNNGTKPWHLGSLEYGRILRRVTLIGRLNYANRPVSDNERDNGYQTELDAYPILGKGTYAYLNAGYSDALLLFPKTRFGAELFQRLPKGFEVSGGARMLNFPDARIMLYTASLSKYYRDFLFSVRGYASFKPGGFTPSIILSGRKYFNGTDDYVMLTLSNGTVPAVAFFLGPDTYLSRLTSNRVSLDFQKGLGKAFYLLGGVWYEYEEYYEDPVLDVSLYRNRYTVNIGLQKRF